MNISIELFPNQNQFLNLYVICMSNNTNEIKTIFRLLTKAIRLTSFAL